MNKIHAEPIQRFWGRTLRHVARLGFDLLICQNQSVYMCNRINQATKGTAFIHYSLNMQSFQSFRTSPLQGLDHRSLTYSTGICLPPFGCEAANQLHQGRFPCPTYYGGSLPHSLFGSGPCHSSSIVPFDWFRSLQSLPFLRESSDVYCI